MDEFRDDEPPPYAPGFEPPTDVNVPWYAWVLWPIGVVTALVVASVLFRGCMGWLS